MAENKASSMCDDGTRRRGWQAEREAHVAGGRKSKLKCFGPTFQALLARQRWSDRARNIVRRFSELMMNSRTLSGLWAESDMLVLVKKRWINAPVAQRHGIGLL